jgi:eukaryotic-like serine/threonine-protein kinase
MAIKENIQRDLVLQQIRRVSDIPAMAETIRHIQDLKGSEDQNITEIANIILKDYALTTKLLKVVNSVIYLPFGMVTTISRAIFLLGIGQIREIALTLMILDHFQKQGSQNLGLEAINQAFFGGFLARNLVRDLRFIEEEEGFICALLHPLGRILTAFALPEAFAAIKQKSRETGVAENLAAMEILGISFEEIGAIIAAEWNFPSAIIQSMRNIRPGELTSLPGEQEKLGLVATLSTEITTALASESNKDEKTAVIEKILKGYERQIPIMEKTEDLISATARDWEKVAQDLEMNDTQSPFSRQMSYWIEPEKEPVRLPKALGVEAESVKYIDAILEQEEPEDVEAIFSKGIQEISNFMMQAYALNDVIHITLETIHRGMKSSQILKTLFLIRDTQKPLMKIRFGFGEGIEEAKRWFVVECEGSDDIFNLALTKSTDLVIQDLQDPKINRLVPSWYRRKLFSPLYIILLPITVNHKNIGLICLEGAQKGFQNIARSHLNYLRILRDQIILAITRVSPKP